jgi:predicted esterase
MSTERTIAATVHGRYLLEIADGPGRHRLLAGFHGYGEHAALQLDRLRAVRGTAAWSLVSIQALHRFYRSGSNEVVSASWMTREDRELMIADNISYVNGVLDAVEQECGQLQTIVYAGFSQGASMAYRAATLGSRQASGVIALGGDIPPELTEPTLAKVGRALVGRGVRDAFYTTDTRDSDVRRLAAAGVPVVGVDFEAEHKWTETFTRSASDWLDGPA